MQIMLLIVLIPVGNDDDDALLFLLLMKFSRVENALLKDAALSLLLVDKDFAIVLRMFDEREDNKVHL